MKSITLLISLMLLSPLIQSECPVHAKIGNAINFARLFKEQADSDWNYQNVDTDFALRLQHIKKDKESYATHYIVFEITDKKVSNKKWFYAVQALYDETDILLKIEKFARFRVYENDQNQNLANQINQLVIDNFFNHRIRAFNNDKDDDLDEHHIFKLHSAEKTTCNPLTKMEYDYFYYLYTNYYKKGGKEGWGLIEPVVGN